MLHDACAESGAQSLIPAYDVLPFGSMHLPQIVTMAPHAFQGSAALQGKLHPVVLNFGQAT